MINIIYPENGHVQSLHTDIHRKFIRRSLQGEHSTSEDHSWLTDTKSELDLTHPAFLVVKWLSAMESHLEISLYPDMRDSSDYPGDPVPAEIEHLGEVEGVRTALIKNMFGGVTYYLKAVSDDGSDESDTLCFRTLGEYPRLIAVEGITNVRDLGLLPTYDGRRIRQGHIYRGVALESTVDNDGYMLTPHGKMQMEYLLGIKNELEIRRDAEGRFTESGISPNVNYNLIVSRGYDYFFTMPEMVENRRKLIEFFADENNYPIYFHCAIGADRTGTLAMILEVLLGVKREYIDLDYNLTSLTLTNIRTYITSDESYGGLSEYSKNGDSNDAITKTLEKFLIEESGVSPETIERLRRNLLE